VPAFLPPVLALLSSNAMLPPLFFTNLEGAEGQVFNFENHKVDKYTRSRLKT
jgi:hypothetical protein